MNKWLVGLACAGMLAVSAMGQEPAVWFNEVCYDPPGTDVAGTEWLEVAGAAGIDLSNYVVVRYNGTGGAPYGTTVLSGTIDDEGCGFGAVDLTYAAQDSLQNGSPDGIALGQVSGGVTTLVQFLSYEGAFAGVGGLADGVTSVNIGTLINTNLTLQLAGDATNYSGFAWTTNAPSKGFLNAGQTIAGCAASPQTNVSFTTSAAAVDENAGTFEVTIIKSLAEGDVGGEIALSGTATEGAGADYTLSATNFTLSGATTSATITVTINDDADQESAETIVLTLAGVTGGTAISPSVFTLTINASDIPTHAIAITPPTNGTVSTTPADSAQEGATVTITATPAGGYAVSAIAVVDADLAPVAVTGNTFTMPTKDVTVTVTFVEAASSGALIISQYYEGTSNNKWIEIYNPGSVAIDLAAAGYRLGQFSNSNRETWKTDGTPALTVVLTGAIPAGGTYLVAHGSATNPAYATANQTASLVHNGDDSVVLFTGTPYAFANVADALGWTAATGAEDRSFVRKSTVTVGVNTDFNAADWDEYTLAAVDGAGAGTNERLGYHSTGAAAFGVTFDQASGFSIEQGTSDVITATAANGTEPYGYAWSSTLDGAYYTTNGNLFTILATAPVGDYSAQVIATDASDPAQSVTNSLNFSVTAPVVKYAIGIVTNAPENGTVTTTPATEAAAGATVTVNASPASGYAVETIAVVDADLGEVTVTGNTFTMPAKAVTVTVTFAVHEGGALIISQYYEGSGNNKWIEIFNPGSTAVDLGADGYRLGTWNNALREGWKTNATPTLAVALSNTLAPGATYLVSYTTVSNPAYATANQTANLQFNGDDSVAIFTGTTYDSANLVDVFGVTSNLAADKSFVRSTAVTAGINTDYNAADWVQFTLAEVEAAAETTNERLGYHSIGPAVFGVSLNRTNGFTIEQGATDAITATAANGTEPYAYGWSSTLDGAYYSASGNVFAILATAPLGDYSATATATDNAALTASNTVTFSVVAPPTKYAISIVTNAPENGTVATTPATEAAAGATVTVAATAAEGYAVESIVVNGGAVTVTGNAFTMPAEPATVTVTFMVYEAPDALVDFEDYTGSYAWNEYVAAGVTWTMTNVYAGNTIDDAKNGTKAGRFENNRGGTNNPAMMTSSAFSQPVTKINFWYANYGVNDGGAFKVQVSDDGAAWQDVGAAEYNPDSKTLVQGVIDSIPAGMTYVQFVTTAGTAQRVNVDDVGIYFGVPTLSVSANRTNGFVVLQGESDAITATAANGTAPYAYGWNSTLGGAYYTASNNVFTILATAPTGSYSATVTATDAVLATAQKTVTFRVNAVDTNAPAVVISGSLSGTLGVQMDLTVTLQNETASDWYIDLKDPDGLDDYSYSFDGDTGAFSFTPAKEGNYALTVTAVTGSGDVVKAVQLAIGAVATPVDIPPVTLATNSTGNFRFTVPGGYAFNRVLGANTTVTNQSLVWSNLIQGVHYSVSGSNVTILTIPQARQILRMGVVPE